MPVLIAPVDPQGREALALLAEASREARALYPELFAPDAPPATNGSTPPGGLYLLAWLDEQPVASGAFRPLDAQTAELRRMYVLPEARRAGVAQALLARLEAEALALGYTRLLLETGYKQEPAMALYRSCGFAPIAPFGDYVGDPTSRCFEKRLSPKAAAARARASPAPPAGSRA